MLKELSGLNGTCTLSDLAKSLKIPRTTALRILTTLELEGFVSHEDTGYKLGNGLINLGLKALANIDIRSLAIPVLHDLAGETGETAHLVVLSEDRALILEVCDSPHSLHVASRPGSLALLHCSAAGKVLLAFCIKDRIRKIYTEENLEQKTSKTITSLSTLEKEIKKVASQGYGLDDEEYFEGVRCVAAPIWNPKGDVIAAIGITGTTTRFTTGKIHAFSQIVIKAAHRISTQMGTQAG